MPCAAPPTPEPSSRIDAKERAQALHEAIGKLPELEREVVILRLHEEIPFREIARIIDAPLGTVLARMHHAKQRLRTLLEPILTP